ncbi:HD family hydrolase [Nocardioides sp. SYSU D00065]|uniref:HD domain-containing protein n=1 Tax=Nocardioides sp. SYSU D00065 TaxID=2817378 RepID=UPI001B3299E7|nr:HD domain-containing protein [Nocardioides sp. SYSU D00065]
MPDHDPVRSPVGDPETLGLSDDLRDRVRFLIRAHELADVARLNRLVSDSRPESSAEHSWHLALTAIVLADHAPDGVRLDRVVKMLLVHDLVEVVTGDTVIFDESARIQAEELERRAAREIFGQLPAPSGAALHELWSEFEDGTTLDARFARALDRLQPILVHWAGAGQAWASRGITADQERAIAARVASFEPTLAPLADALVQDAIGRGLLRPS